MILFFDTETTGLVQFSLPHDHPSQPHLVQLGCVLTEDDGTIRATLDLIVRPSGYVIPRTASDIHGITTEIAERCGVPLVLAVSALMNLGVRADRIVAHNLPFDERVMTTAIQRTGRQPTLQLPTQRACTLEMAEPILKIPATAKMVAAGYGHKFKKPNLGECYEYFFGEKLQGAHSAIIDAQACAKIYFRMTRGAGRQEYPRGFLAGFLDFVRWSGE